MPHDKGIELITQAIEADKKEKAWQTWLVLLQRMNNDTYMSFETFYERFFCPKIDLRTAEEIIKEAERTNKELKHGIESF